MTRNVFSRVAQKAGGLTNVLFINDIDLSYMDTMDTGSTREQQEMMWEIAQRTEGGVIFMSGRALKGIDATFPGGYVASAEHHSVMRLEHGANAIALAPVVDTAALANTAIDMIGQSLVIARTPAEVRNAHGKTTIVYPEVKDFAVALVHSLHHEGVANAREILQAVAADVIKTHNLSDSHKITVGGDAIEIVPKGMSPHSEALLVLPQQEIRRLQENGLNKGSGLHGFMCQKAFANRVPFVTGDSGSDGVAMIEAQKYGGGGIWVKNGNPVPEKYMGAVNGFQIESFRDTWGHVAAFLEECREHAPVVHMMPSENLGVIPSGAMAHDRIGLAGTAPVMEPSR